MIRKPNDRGFLIQQCIGALFQYSAIPWALVPGIGVSIAGALWITGRFLIDPTDLEKAFEEGIALTEELTSDK